MKKPTKQYQFLPSDEVVKIPLSRLTIGSSNVRKMESKNLNGLAQSLLENGQEQNVVVVITQNDSDAWQYEIVAGKRRYLAFQLLVEEGRISADTLVDAKVKLPEVATITSLTENFHREPMHPIDEFKAFKQLADEGLSVLEISLKFGVTELLVRQRLALGSAAPELLNEVLTGEMELSQLMVLCQIETHERQKEVWFSIPKGYQRSALNLKSLLRDEDILITSKLVKFVGLEAYEAAGGKIVRDLFSTDGNDGAIADAPLLKSLVNQKLQEFEQSLLSQGWKWAHYSFDRDYQFDNRMKNIYPQVREMTAEEDAQSAAWAERLEAIEIAMAESEDNDDEEASEALNVELSELEDKLLDLDNSLEFWGDDKEIAGVYFAVGRDGQLDIVYGLVKPEDYKQSQAELGPESSASVAQANEAASDMSTSLKDNLACVRAGAMQAELIKNARIGMVLLCHTLALKTFYNQWYGDTFFDISLTSHSGEVQNRVENFNDSVAGKAITKAYEVLKANLPANKEELLDVLLGFNDGDIQSLITFCMAGALRIHYTHRDHNERYSRLNRLLGSDIRQYWQPTSSTFFSRLKKPEIVRVLQDAEVGTDGVNEGMKKGEMASKAEKLIQRNPDWLPDLLVA